MPAPRIRELGPRVPVALRAAAVVLVALLFALLVDRLATETAGPQLSTTVLRGRPLAPPLELEVIWRSAPSWPAALRPLAEQRRLSIRALEGRPTIVNFWASWCQPCKHEIPLLLAAANRERGKAVFLGVDLNDFTGDARGFLARHRVNYISVHGGDGTAQSYGLIGLPETYYLNAAGRVVGRTAGEVTSAELRRGIARALAG
jgi:cytochrome c biogenesis protein CcmG, thiol:disulfide interchange protein DsbE